MANELPQLVSKRGTCKAQLTRFSKFIDSFNIEQSSVVELQKRLEKVENVLYPEFDSIQSQIQILDDTDLQEDERSNFENVYYKYSARAEELIKQHTTSGQSSSAENTSSSSNLLDNTASNSPSLTGIKLPTIKLPSFQGAFDSWLEFYDTFDSLINKNAQINNIQKFHYLKSCVTGEAARVISSLETSAANFDVAWNLLCDRYDNKRLLKHNHIKALFNLPSVNKESSVQLRNLIDNVNKNLRSLETLGQSTEEWDPLLIYMITTKLDSVTTREWEEEAHKSTDDSQSLDSFLTFLKNKADLLETIETNKSVLAKTDINKNSRNKNDTKQKSFLISKYSCSLCKQSHRIFKCPEFQKLPVSARLSHVQKSNLCVNCLNSGHSLENCRFGSCRKCSEKHNSLLHDDSVQQNAPQVVTKETDYSSHNKTVALSSYVSSSNQTLLSTAVIKVFDKQGHPRECRVLLDSASESSFITRNLCDALGLDKTNFNISITGIGQISSQITHKCDVRIQSMHNGFSFTLSCLVIANICERMPSHRIDASTLKIPTNIFLADPNFHVPSSIDMLIGADLFWSLLCIGQIKLGDKLPILQKTKLGWIISGPVGISLDNRLSYCHFTKNSDIQNQLERFWAVQEMDGTDRSLSQEEVDFENHFVSTFRRHSDGKFVVTIPFKESIDLLGNSEDHAKKRFYNLERKLQKNQDLNAKYVRFIREYEALGHMSKVTGTANISDAKVANFFPHHGVLKEDNLTTKLRVVFDGSCPTTSGVSLNQIQMVGAPVQDDLLAILLRFRQFSFVVSSDIEKMYRCVWITPEQRPLQLIYWRENSSDPLEVFQLNTVTYGTANASFLAIRCLHQLSIDSADEFPQASEAIAHSFYVDDLLHGSDSQEELSDVCRDVSNILHQAGFNLRKWVSNEPNVLKNIQIDDVSTDLLKLGSTKNSKTLGIFWSPNLDILSFKISVADLNNRSTKRSILSGVSQIYDPLGLLSACIVTVKILLQKLWLEKLSWDESVSIDLHSKWVRFRRDILQLNSLHIPRHIRAKKSVRTELHCFCDASQDAYAACVYVRSSDENGEIMVHLLCAKSRVAPLKVLTIPRLELQGALILARLSNNVLKSLRIKFDDIFYWTDSAIVLGWLRTSPHLLKTFVSNRIGEIQTSTDVAKWRHVSSGDNPADLASRGVSPTSLLSCDLWWHGPKWLLQNSDSWPSKLDTSSEGLPEMKIKAVTLVSKTLDFQFPFERYSNYLRLIHSVAYCFRFANNCRARTMKKVGSISTEEMSRAILALVKIIQRQHFASEYSALSDGKPLHSKNCLLGLSPFLSDDEVIRVGGRLKNSQFSYDKRHPLLLPKNHHFVKLLFRYEHQRLCHAGPTQLLSSIRDKFWPISGKNTAKQIVHSCMRCYRAKPVSIAPLMGELPASRVTPSPPFCFTGVDYAGPFTLKDRKSRGCKFIKGYVALFVCFSTKAIHLELVTELSTECFIAALRRFMSRRGKPSRMVSDNGTNFLGAKNELYNISKFLRDYDSKIVEATALEGSSWTFIPPYSPHFGGLWESGVKSTKFHLKRILGNANLTYEDFLTVLVQIEGILNSRPLSPLSTNPNDLAPLTPSHFLIGRPITTIPDPDLLETKENRLSKFQHMQQLVQHFWARWSSEYINELQVRKKWKLNRGNLKIGALVLIKEKMQPPLCWALGRVQDLHPGKDGISRVASIRTVKGVIRRAIVNLCPLPLSSDTSQPEERQC